MHDHDLVAFLQHTLPELRLRWPGFRKVRARVGKKLRRRLRELGLSDLESYRRYLEDHPGERATLDALCRVVVTHFYRDRGVWDALEHQALPALARRAVDDGRDELRAWSAGCASGEEAFTLSMLWSHRVQPKDASLRLSIVATDADARLLERAERGRFPESAVRRLPQEWRSRCFARTGDDFALLAACRGDVTFACQDIRQEQPGGLFDLVLCRNMAFTYFDVDVQRDVARAIANSMRGDALLVVGQHESVPQNCGLAPAGLSNVAYSKR